jgi:hypothetical protein
MHITHHSRLALLAAAATLILMMLALMLPATLQNLDFSIGLGDSSAQTDVSTRGSSISQEPSWANNPLTWPLLQAPAK